MTYCVEMALSQGLVFAADSRTNAGVDQIATFRKLHKFHVPGERLIVLMTAGNLANTQSVLSLLRMRLHSDRPNLFGVASLYEVATIVGATNREVVKRDSGLGQINGEAPRLFLVYPEGNFIECSRDTPYFQIGETKYGKPILDRVVEFDTPLESAVQCVLLSLDSTIRSNLSVGLPLDVLSYSAGSFSDAEHYNVDEQHEGFRALGEAWSQGLRDVFQQLPAMRW